MEAHVGGSADLTPSSPVVSLSDSSSSSHALPSPSADRDTTETLDHTDPNLSESAPVPTTSLPFSSPSLPHPSSSPTLPSLPPSIPSPSSRAAFSSYFSLPATAAFLTSHSARRVALQFPDSLLPLSPHITQYLTALLPPSTSLYVLADTSYAPCCVDVTAAQHCNADAIVHYGTACLSTSYTLPVYFAFGQAPLDLPTLSHSLLTPPWGDEGEGGQARDDALVFCDVEYEWKMAELTEWLARGAGDRSFPRRIVVARVQPAYLPPTPTSVAQDEQQQTEVVTGHRHCIAGHEFTLPSESALSTFRLLFLGAPASPVLANLMLTYNTLPAYVYDPAGDRPGIQPAASTAAMRRLLARRYYLTQHAMSARIIGLLIGVLSHAAVLGVVERLQGLVKAAGKKSYTVAVGKVNPSKLANFADVDLWCLISCPYAALIPNPGGVYFTEIVTPRELEMALTGRPWTGEYSTDMTSVAAGEVGETERRVEGEEEGAAEVVFDSATGKLRGVLPTFNRGGTALITREEGQVVRTAVDAMRERSWKGLETEHDRRLRMLREAKEDEELGIGEEGGGAAVEERIAAAVAEQGLQGIASRYTKEL